MNSNALDDLCLICCNYSCEIQSFHKKSTLRSFQNLLIKNLYLTIQIQKLYSAQSFYQSFSISTNQSIFKQTTQQQNENHFYSKRKCEVQSEIQKIEKHFDKFLTKQYERQIRFALLIFSLVELVQTIKFNSLFYHDIFEIIKLIIFYSFKTDLSHQQFVYYLTQSRTQRTIKQLKKKIFIKQQLFSTIFSYQQLQTKKTIHNIQKLFKNQVDQRLLQQTLKQTQIYKQISQIFFDYRKNEVQEKAFEILQKVFEKMNHLQRCYLAKYSHYQNQSLNANRIKSANWSLSRQNLSKNRFEVDRQKRFYPITSKTHSKSELEAGELIQTIQYAYIEGIPFPTNRRSLDFSMLELTDQLLISYLPALNKFKNLEQLCIRNNKLTSISYNLIKNTFLSLKSLDIRQNLITSQILKVLLNFKQLKILYISDCKISSNALIKICVSLQCLNVLYCDRLHFVDFQTEYQGKENNFDFNQFMGIFYIMCLNLKKLVFLSLKGYLNQGPAKIQKYFKDQKHVEETEFNQTNNRNILANIKEMILKRQGILQL